MSFVNLLGNDLWSETDIVNRTESILHSAVSKVDEQILSRKMIGFSLNLLIPSNVEQQQLTAYQEAGYAAQAAGFAARADMALLLETIALEKAQTRIAQELPPSTIVIEGVEAPNPDLPLDLEERAAAQTVIDSASTQAKDLAILRGNHDQA